MSRLKQGAGQQQSELRRQWLEEARQTGDGDTYAGKRGTQRFTWRAPLDVRVSPGGMNTETHLAQACDISAHGIRFCCKQPVEPLTEVEVFVTGESLGVRAMVRHCTPTISGFLVGTDFLD